MGPKMKPCGMPEAISEMDATEPPNEKTVSCLKDMKRTHSRQYHLRPIN